MTTGRRSTRSAAGDERAFTAGLARFFGGGAGILVGIGDDAAVVHNRAAESVLCCDPVVEGVHFTAGTDPALVGRKAVNRNLSDLAAMGARVDWLLVSLVLPPRFPRPRRNALLRGIRSAAAASGGRVVGGDVAVARGPLVVTVSAIGHCEHAVLRRDAAHAGDALHVTGPLGGSRLGRHLRFRPALAEGQWLARHCPPVRAAIDVSDGLLLDLATLLQASGGLGAELDEAALPVAAAAHRLARGDANAALQHAFGDGEDHVLLFSVAAGAALPRGGPLLPRARRAIGRVLARPGLFLRRRDGTRVPLRKAGWQHAL